MKRVIASCFAVLCFNSSHAVESSWSAFHFFAGSTRRDADTIERDQVVRVGKGGCTAYFVENTAGKVYIGSARHCFQLAATNWCKNGGYFTDNDGKVGKCVRLLAGDTKRDIVFFEADFTYAPRQTLRLAGADPALGTDLKMVGYPCDKYRKCALTTTETCRVLKVGIPSPHSAAMADRSGLHDCTTYGGNSGGPMLAAGTNLVVALPFTYLPGHYTEYPSGDEKQGATLALMSDFVAVHRAELEAAGVVIQD